MKYHLLKSKIIVFCLCNIYVLQAITIYGEESEGLLTSVGNYIGGAVFNTFLKEPEVFVELDKQAESLKKAICIMEEERIRTTDTFIEFQKIRVDSAVYDELLRTFDEKKCEIYYLYYTIKSEYNNVRDQEHLDELRLRLNEAYKRFWYFRKEVNDAMVEIKNSLSYFISYK